MKSKMSPMATISISMKSAGLSILHHDPFQSIGNVFGAIGGVLQMLVDLTPAHGFDKIVNVTHAIELRGECLIKHLVGFTFEPVYVYRALEQLVPLPPVFKQCHSTGDEGCLLIDNVGRATGILS